MTYCIGGSPERSPITAPATVARALVAALALLGCSWLVGCSRASTEYFVVESQGRATLEIGVSKFGVCTNLHGGCAQIYQFEFPAKTSVVPAGAILSYRVDYKIPEPSELPETGQIMLTTRRVDATSWLISLPRAASHCPSMATSSKPVAESDYRVMPIGSIRMCRGTPVIGAS